MIPLRDNSPTNGKPYIVYGLVAVNVVVFIAQQLGLFDNLTMIPYSVVRDMRVQLASQYGKVLMDQWGHPTIEPLPGVGPHPQWITIFTSMFMHGSFMHIGGNMLYLWIFGNNIEDALGHVKFLLFYLTCGVAAALLHVYMSLSGISAVIPTLGASGAIAGVLGAYVVLYPKAKIDTLLTLGWFWHMIQIPAYYVLGVWFLLQLTGTFGTGGQVGGGVAYWAHVGGFVAGMGLIWVFGGRRGARQQRSNPGPWNEDRPYPFRPWK